ncbi:MAG: hypothetical protein F6K40_31005 [Okeania sp. SIO3I5]|nr:hypothetical protein [Okeania sp. SIO3I5]NEQ40423.1 hypothetical protein [Okeania sp. SIO3I5]
MTSQPMETERYSCCTCSARCNRKAGTFSRLKIAQTFICLIKMLGRDGSS